MGDLRDKVIVVTGAGSGVGRAAALIFSRSGAKIIAADVNAESAKALADEIAGEGGTCRAFEANIAVEADVVAMIDASIETFGRLDGAFNNAGVPQSGARVEDITAADWSRVIDVNLTGTFNCLKHEARVMLEAGGGSIVNTASALGVVGMPRATDYIASKHGIIGLTKGASIDLAASGIRVNAILPGAIRTPMIEAAIAADPPLADHVRAAHTIGRIAEPDEIAEMAAWLLSDAASFVTGASMSVDGGYTTH